MILPALLLLAPALIAQEIPEVSRVIEEALAKKQIPGAVALISHNGKTIHRKAYGLRSLEHPGERMTLDTIFDAASLTKVIATTSSIAKLYEGGWIDLDKP